MKSGTELRPLSPFLPPLLSNFKVHTAPPPSLRSKRKVEEDGKGGRATSAGGGIPYPTSPTKLQSHLPFFSFRLSPRIKKEKEKGEETTFSDLKIGRCCHGSREKERGIVHGVIENGGAIHTERAYA